MKKAFFLIFWINFVSFQWHILNANETIINQQFQQQLQKTNQFLSQNQQLLKQDPKLLLEYVDKELLPYWSAEDTLRAMIGVERWKNLTASQQTELTHSYQHTMRRYLFEVTEKYQGQTLSVQKIQLNSKKTKGWLTLLIETPMFPSINVDLKIRQNVDIWTVYDFRFQGISFVKMKQTYFRTLLDEKGFDYLLNELNDKNQEFKKNLRVAKK